MAILDMAIPGASPEVVERLYGCYPGIRLLLTSSQDDSTAAKHIGRPGRVREFIRKPFRRSQLLGRVLQLLTHPSPIPPSRGQAIPNPVAAEVTR